MAVIIAALAVTGAAVAAESAPATARLAGRLACWAAYRRYAGNPDRAARRAEEWQALACRRPGRRILGLLTAARFALAAVRALLAARWAVSAQAVQSAGRDEEGTTAVPVRPMTVTTDTLLVGASLESAPAEWDAARAVTAIYTARYRSLVRLAVLLVRDVATAEEVVQDSFIAMHAAWRRLRDEDRALSYLRQSVVNRSRSVLRHRVVVDKNAPKPAPDMPSAEQGAISLLERSAVIAALRTLPPRQREALVLKYYADLSEAQIATAMGISRGAVKSHTARGVAALRIVLEMAAEILADLTGAEPSPRRRRIVPLTAMAVTLVAAVTVTAIVLGNTSAHNPTATQAPAPVAARTSVPERASAARELTFGQLRAGDCLQGPLDINTASPWPYIVTAVPCPDKHLAEVYFSANYWPGAMAFPGNAKIAHRAKAGCRMEFKAYDGITYSKSHYNYSYLTPWGQVDWDSGDRLLMCVAYSWTSLDPGGVPIFGSIKGSYS